MVIIPTLQAKHLLKSTKGNTRVTLLIPDLNRDGKRHFSDGEIYVKIPTAKQLYQERVVVLHSGGPKPNEGLIELELILQILRDNKVKNIEVFFTYFSYAMQDRVFDRGETNVAENLVEKLVGYYGVKKIYIIDAHFWGRKWATRYPITHVTAVPLLMQRAIKDFGNNILFATADKGGKRRTKIAGMQKERKNSQDIEMQSSKAFKKSIKGKTVAVVDDLVNSGGTLERFYQECKKAGAKEVIALITHGVLTKGIERTQKTYKKLYLSNTVHRKAANVDVSELILQTILE